MTDTFMKAAVFAALVITLGALVGAPEASVRSSGQNVANPARSGARPR